MPETRYTRFMWCWYCLRESDLLSVNIFRGCITITNKHEYVLGTDMSMSEVNKLDFSLGTEAFLAVKSD